MIKIQLKNNLPMTAQLHVDWCLKFFFECVSRSLVPVLAQVIFRQYYWWDFIVLVLTFVGGRKLLESYYSPDSFWRIICSDPWVWMQTLCCRCIFRWGWVLQHCMDFSSIDVRVFQYWVSSTLYAVFYSW